MLGNVLFQVVRPRESTLAMRALMVLLPSVNPEMSVKLIRSGEPPLTALPRADERLVPNVRPQVRPQVRSFLVLLGAVGIVTSVHVVPVETDCRGQRI